MKKFLAIALAVLMVFSLTVIAFADTTAPLSDRTHTYTAYQIFSGTQTDDQDDATLGAVEWGDGIDAAAFLSALTTSTAFGTDNPFEDCETAADVAKAMKDWADKSDNAKAFAKLAEDYVVAAKGIACENGITSLDAGYYLVVDTTETVQADDAYNVALLQLTKKDIFKIEAKNSVPEVEKKINNGLICEEELGETHPAHTKECYDWQDANNAAIGDTVEFRIDSAVPATAKEYEYYFFIVNDTLSKGLTYDASSLKVYIGGELAAVTTDYTVKTAAVMDTNNQETGETNIQIALVEALDHAGESVVVTYEAAVNEDAMIGVEGNPNKVTVKFSNNPNEDFDSGDIPSDGFPKDTTHTPKGETPKDTTITYVSKINVYKVDENKDPLQGAEFTLSGETLNQVLVLKEQFTKDEDGTYYKLTNGTYTEEEPITADSMEPAASGATEGYVEAEADYSKDDTVIVDGVTYRPYNPTTDAGKAVFIYNKKNVSEYASTSDMYKREWVSETKTADGTTMSVVGTVDENGVVSFAGLPAGSYTLSETVVPNGYNPIDDIEFTTTWTAPDTVTTGTEECTWAMDANDTSNVDYNEDADAFEITIVNEKGNTLPETGGIGTTIFYIAGGVLLAGAAILLITKKRMGAED